MAAGSGLKGWEHPKGSGIKIREILNVTNGDAYGGSYLVVVPAKLTGTVRKRKQFKTKELAEDWAERQQLGQKRQGEDFFRATNSERRQFVECLPKLREKGIEVSEAVEFAIKHLKPVGGEKTVGEVVEELFKSKQMRFERGDLRKTSIDDFRVRARKFSDAFDEVPIIELQVEQIKDWLLGLGGGPRTTQNYLSFATEIMNHAVQSRCLVKSPLDYLTTNERKELCGSGAGKKEPSVLSVDEARRLVQTAYENPKLKLLAAVVLGLFCGIRTEEIKRLDWKQVRDGDSQPIVTISSAIAKKRRIRHVDISDNARLWLSTCKDRLGRVTHSPINNDYQRRFRTLLKLAGFGGEDEQGVWRSGWDANAMRHSFGSYHFALHGDSLETSRQLGHKASDQVLFDHYRALATKKQAERYFAIKPAIQKSKVVRIAG